MNSLFNGISVWKFESLRLSFFDVCAIHETAAITQKGVFFSTLPYRSLLP
ncbi:hypothetical protein [Nitrosomonas sp.]|nr:hypothetical protein [Nitrosomonas sp.]